MTTENLLPDNIRALAAYRSAKSEKLSGSTWLNANESPFEREINVTLRALNRYPDPQPQAVINAYAGYAGIAPEQAIMTRGADEAIELIIRTYCQSGVDSIAIFQPTYGMYKVSADSHNVAVNALEQTLLHEGNITSIAEAVSPSKLVFVCNPNNPTGATVEPAKIEALCDALRGRALVVVDEAYIEFCPEISSIELLSRFDNLLITRTLSKAFALAGLRVGFLLGNENTLKPVRKVLAPYPVSGVVASIAADALTPDAVTSMRRQVAILNELKKTLSDWLEASPRIETLIRGQGNFVTVKLQCKSDLQRAYETGLIMRPFTLYGEDSWLRISIGNTAELEQVKRWLDAPAAQQENEL